MNAADRLLPALLFAACLALPAHAVPPAEPAEPPEFLAEEGEGLPFSAFLSEDEMRLLFDYMRDAIIAAMKGKEAGMPPELAFKLSVLRQRLMKEGNAAVRQLMWMLREELDRALDELPQSPPPPPRTERTRT